MAWHDWLVLGLAFLVFGGPILTARIPPHWWYVSPAKRRSMRVAVQTARRLFGAEVDGGCSFIRRRDREKCFVFLQHRGNLRPPVHSVFVVWREGERVDDLGGWQFHWGLFWPDQPIEAYEQCQAAGLPWPVGATEWLQWARGRGQLE
jgi:hypothetical protein